MSAATQTIPAEPTGSCVAPAELPARIRVLVTPLLPGRPVRMVLLTGSTVDVGRWVFRGRLWLVATDDAILLAAAGPIPYLQELNMADLADAVYSPVTGELVLGDPRTVDVRGVRLRPVAARDVLNWIQKQRQSKDATHA